MILSIIISHKNTGDSLIEAAKSIAGSADRIVSLSNEGLSTNELTTEIQAFCNSHEDEPVIIFVDLFGGSCWRAAKMARAENARIISGLNLPMLLSFIQKRDSVSPEELPEILVNDGHRGISLEKPQ
jgi:mannose/fructose-specific phosphotransferase system component IIA